MGPGAPFTLGMVSKTERDLAGDSVADALDEIFDDADFDEALDDALDEADDSVPIRRPAEALDEDVEADVDGGDDTCELRPPICDDRADAEHLDRDPTGEVELVDSVDADDAVADSDVGDDPELVDADGDLDDAAETMSADASDGFEMPEIVPATPDDELIGDAGGAGETDDADAFVEPLIDEPDIDELDPDEVAEEILEELRRADIDGPQVEMAPQDETTAARRRPRRAVDYDPAPVPIPAKAPRVLGRKPRVRKVTRVVRHVDPWSVFKIAIVANLVLYITLLISGVLLWNVAHATGTVDNIERFFESFGWESFEFNGGEIYHAAWIAGLFGVVGLTGFAVLLATLFNLITDLVGGVRFTVLEEEVIETRTSPLRRFVVRRPEPEVPATVHDASGAMVREAVVDDTGANARPSR